MKVAYTSCYYNRNKTVDTLFCKHSKDGRIERIEKLCFCITRATIDHPEGYNFVWFEIYFDELLGNYLGCFKMLEALYSQMNKTKCTIYPSHQTTIYRDKAGNFYGCGGNTKHAETSIPPSMGCIKELLPHGKLNRLKELKEMLNNKLKENEIYWKIFERQYKDRNHPDNITKSVKLMDKSRNLGPTNVSFKINDFNREFTFAKFKDELSKPLEFTTEFVEFIRGEVYKKFNEYLSKLIRYKYSQPKLCGRSKSYIVSSLLTNTIFYYDEIKNIILEWQKDFIFSKYYNPYTVINSGDISPKTPNRLLEILSTKNYENFIFIPNDKRMFEDYMNNRRKKHCSDSDEEVYFDAVETFNSGDIEKFILQTMRECSTVNTMVNRTSIIFEVASTIGRECLLEIHTEAINSARKFHNALQEELYSIYKENLIDVIAANILILGRLVVTTYNYFMYTLSMEIGVDFDTLIFKDLTSIGIIVYEYEKCLMEVSRLLCNEASRCLFISKANYFYWTVFMKDIGDEKLDDVLQEFLTLISSSMVVDLKACEVEDLLFA